MLKSEREIITFLGGQVKARRPKAHGANHPRMYDCIMQGSVERGKYGWENHGLLSALDVREWVQ